MSIKEISGRYFDGQSAYEHSIKIKFDFNGIHIYSENGQEWFWLYKNTRLLIRNKDDFRLCNETIDDAILILPNSAQTTMTEYMPALFSNAEARWRATRLILTLIAGSSVLTAGIFIGFPMASGPLAQMTPKDYEITMGENFAAQINTFIKPCENAGEALLILNPVIREMAEVGNVGFPIEFDLVNMNAPNAFALPGGQVMATKGLLRVVGEDQEAFMAVLAHELGHVHARDGMQAYYRNAGLGVMVDIITGGSGLAQQAVQLSGQINQLRHSREQEALADDKGIEIMQEMGINPEALARAFEALTGRADTNASETESQQSEDKTDKRERKKLKVPSWLSSHPDTISRIEKARSAVAPSTRTFFSESEWNVIRNGCASLSDEEDKE